MSRARRPVRLLGAGPRLSLVVALAFEPWGDPLVAVARRLRTRPSILRGAVLGQRVSASAAARLLANLGAT